MPVRKLKIQGRTVTIKESTSKIVKLQGGRTSFDERGRWVPTIEVDKNLSRERKRSIIIHELAEGLSGIGAKLPSKARHKKIKRLENTLKKKLKGKHLTLRRRKK